MVKVWKLKPEIPQQIAEQLSSYPLLVRQLLYNRNIKDKKAAAEFLDPKYDGLYSPFLFKDMQKATERIWQAIEHGEKICIYGDYDADAVTANAVLRQTFNLLGAKVESYIPDRFNEGYGLNLDALSKIKDQGSKIIITVDCGANAIEAAEWCHENRIDLIITDHHEVLGEIPKAFAFINPKNLQDSYPDQNITGVGVAFKLAQGILDKLKVKSEKYQIVAGWEKWLLDLVAIGTVADCHSLLGENRILVKYGLLVLAKSKWAGLQALCAKAGLDFSQKPPDTYTLGFIIAPRLNAAGRLEHANIALNLLMDISPVTAQEKAVALENLNLKRQQLTVSVLSEAKSQAELIGERKILALTGADWPRGIVGLVAGRIAEEFYRPTIVLEKGQIESTGSARTVGEFNIVEALSYASRHLVRFGGHKQAAGLTLKTEHFEIFYQTILEYAEANLKEEDLQKKLVLDAELQEEDLQLATCNLLTNLEPFGVDNPKPKFLIQEMRILSLRAVGAQSQHLQIKLEKGNSQIAAIAFNFGNFAQKLKIGDTADIACELMEDGWNGKKVLKLKVIDIKQHEKINYQY